MLRLLGTFASIYCAYVLLVAFDGAAGILVSPVLGGVSSMPVDDAAPPESACVGVCRMHMGPVPILHAAAAHDEWSIFLATASTGPPIHMAHSPYARLLS